MDAQRLVQSKKEVVAALKAQQYDAAREILQQVHDAAPQGGTPLDPLLSELLSTLQQKVAQDAATAADSGEEEEGSTDSDESSSVLDDSSSEAASSDDGCDTGAAQTAEGDIVHTSQQHADSSQEPGCSSHAGVCAGASSGSCSSQAELLPQAQQAQAGNPSTAGQDDHVHSTPADAADEDLPAQLSGIRLAAGSCSLSHSQRAHLKQQLAAGLEQDKAAAALAKALAADPLLSLSLS